MILYLIAMIIVFNSDNIIVFNSDNIVFNSDNNSIQ